ncbi:hypothetical protein K7X08_008415 [Anisodus acutangulus]|uniref:BRWD/PHIP N-terminal domain-containing protein n=1 Tax=Anisodus acutangulus TaxID=402998 RepID=A0A9Q1MW55_9SOLA|nr:hypothetical protein K7X08_008415 [Anisodus acutangulus]
MMDSGKCTSRNGTSSSSMAPTSFLNRVYTKPLFDEEERFVEHAALKDKGVLSGDEDDDGVSFPLNYDDLVLRYPHVEKDHLVKLLKQLLLSSGPPLQYGGGDAPGAADVPTLLGSGPFSLLACERNRVNKQGQSLPSYLRWPHMQANQVHGLTLREIGAIFDRSGRYVITGSDDRLVKVWSMETRLCLASCRGHQGDITDLAVSSNNALVASASNDYSIRVWRLPDGLPISVLRGHNGAVTAIAFTPKTCSVYQLLSMALGF